MIFLLAVLAFVALILYKLFGFHLYWVLALLAVAYLAWGKKLHGNTHTDNLAVNNSVTRFIQADAEMTTLQHEIQYIQDHDKYVYAQITKDIYDFYELYLDAFTNGISKFDMLVDKRREILNALSTAYISGLEVSDDIITRFSDCTWKYVKILITKYDLPYSYPIAHNTIDPRDLY